MTKGQKVQVHHKGEENWWEYGVVIDTFDDRVEVKTENNTRIMWHQDKENENLKDWLNRDIFISELKFNGEPILCKKTLFGKYKIH